jgi:uncharacterized protein
MISPRYFREISQRYRLEAGKCDKCSEIYFPPRLICPECKSKKFTTVKLSDNGEIITYTIIRVASEKFSIQAPYAVAIIKLTDGVKLTAQLADVDFDKIKIGRKVKLVFRKILDEGASGLHCYGYKAVVV